MDPAELRAQFPVFERVAYLNAGSCGPVPQAAVTATAQAVKASAQEGRGKAWFEATQRLRDQMRGAYAALIDAEPHDVALTNSTSDGIARVLAGLDLRAGDEILTSDEEHPGLLAPLANARARYGATVRAVPLQRIHEEVGQRTVL